MTTGISEQESVRRLRGRKVLIVEDEYLIATDLARAFNHAGADIIGPVLSLAKALALIEAERIDGAVIDIALDGEDAFPLADALIERGVFIVFVTGYDRSFIPARFDAVPLCIKPIDAEKVIEAFGGCAI